MNLTLEQAARVLKCSQKTVIRRIHAGQLPAHFENWGHGKRYCIDVLDILHYEGIDPDKSLGEIALKMKGK